MTRRRRSAWLGGYVAATFLAFPHPIGGFVLDLGWLLAWLSPALLLVGLQGLRPRRAAGVAFLASLAAHACILHWIYVVTVTYGHAPPAVGVIAPVGLAAYIAVFGAAFGAGWSALARVGLASPLTAALWWTSLDHLRSFAMSGFPWATLGYAQHQNPALMALVPSTGVYGLSFLTVLGGAALGCGLLHARAAGRPGFGVWAAAGVVVAAHLMGLGLLTREPAEVGPTVRIAVLQGNIDQGEKWHAERVEETLQIYETLSYQAAAEGAQVIVWPETAVPGVVDTERGTHRRFERLARDTGAAYVIGAVGLALRGGEVTDVYDSAFLFGADGEFSERYDKSHLVPFGEYVPFQNLIGRLLKAVARGIATTGVSAGPGPRAVSIALAPEGGIPKLTAGVVICYELLFPDLVRRFVGDGAGVLLAITNDAWYGRTGAPYQFLAITAVRSAETRVWTARAANTGVSAIIDARGRVVERTQIFERDLIVADVPLRPPPIGGSFYTRHGDVFAASAWLGMLVVGFTGLWRAKRGGEGREHG